MGIKLNRWGIFVLGTVIIYSYYLYNRLNIVFRSTQTTGVVVPVSEVGDAWHEQLGKHTCAKFYHPMYGDLYAVNYDDGLAIGETVAVLYNNKSPGNAQVYSIYGFWLRGLMFTILPYVLWIAFALGYVHPQKTITIKIPFTNPKEEPV